MSNFNFDSKQFETMMFGPARAYAFLSVALAEKLINTQLDVAKSYSDTGLSQLRSLMEVKDAESLKSYLEGQQHVVTEFTERLKADTEKVLSLQHDFVKDSQKLTEENVQTAQEVAQESTEAVKESTEIVVETGKETSPKAAKTSK